MCSLRDELCATTVAQSDQRLGMWMSSMEALEGTLAVQDTLVIAFKSRNIFRPGVRLNMWNIGGDKRTDKQPGRLETPAHSEFSAKVSFFEFYNEELFASGSNSASRKDGEAMKMDANTALRIFDDTLKEVSGKIWTMFCWKIVLMF